MKNKTIPEVMQGSKYPSLYWDMSGVINPSPEAKDIFIAAERRFYEEVASGLHREVYLLSSLHWTTEGYWIEFDKPQDLIQTVIIKQWPESTN